MPTLADFDPRPATMLWLNKKQRRKCEPQKMHQQKWFANIFEPKNSESDIKEHKSQKVFLIL